MQACFLAYLAFNFDRIRPNITDYAITSRKLSIFNPISVHSRPNIAMISAGRLLAVLLARDAANKRIFATDDDDGSPIQL